MVQRIHSWSIYNPRMLHTASLAHTSHSLMLLDSGVFTSLNRYSDRKKATFKDSGFSLHVKPGVHANAMTRLEKQLEKQQVTVCTDGKLS